MLTGTELPTTYDFNAQERALAEQFLLSEGAIPKITPEAPSTTVDKDIERRS